MKGKNVTDQQKYLLGRIPSIYNMNGHKPTPDTAEVKKARKLIERWEKAESLRECKAKKRNQALIIKAREAIYFSPPEKALRIVQQCEKLLKGCPV